MNLKNIVDYCRINDLDSPFARFAVPAPLNRETAVNAIMIRCGLLTPVYGEPDTLRDIIGHWSDTKQWTFEHLIKVVQAEYSPIENVFEDRTETSIYGSSKIKSGGFKDTNSGKDTVAESGTDQRDIVESGTDQRDIVESGTDQRDIVESGTDQRDIVESGTDQRDITNSGTDTTTNTISAFNATGYQPDSKSELLNGKTVDDDITYGKSVDDDITYGKSVDDDITYGKSIDDDITYGKSIDDDTTYGKQVDTTHGHTVERVYNNETDAHAGKDVLEISRHGNVGTISADELIQQELDLLRHFDIYGFIAELFEKDNMIMVY